MKIDENLHWILSFYRNSEISGALFFGELARSLRPSPIQQDMTRHFADEANHARHWTDCLEQLGTPPLKLSRSYQDQYIAAAGMPTNVMEIDDAPIFIVPTISPTPVQDGAAKI